MKQVRFGVIGVGNMGNFHLRTFADLENTVLSAVCDTDQERRDKAAAQYNVPAFADHHQLFDSGLIDAALVVTPHYDHPPIAIDAFAKNIHVLVEKPIAVSVKAARQLNEAYKNHPDLVFGIMYNQRTSPMYQKMRELIAEGELGELTRITWLITDWFRTWAYYASGGWRATWAGEGGGVLINQCPHNLDLLQWITGLMPNRITAVGSIAKTHPIEVEDDISAILEYPNGAIGHFVTTTGEAPGTNRLEICGDRGKLIAEKGTLTFVRTRQSVREVREKSPETFVHIESWEIDVPVKKKPEGHAVITQGFIDAIVKGTPLLAPGVEGVHGLEIGNAMLMAGLTRKPVDLPLDGDAFDNFLQDMIKTYGGKKSLSTPDTASTASDMSGTF